MTIENVVAASEDDLRPERMVVSSRANRSARDSDGYDFESVSGVGGGVVFASFFRKWGGTYFVLGAAASVATGVGIAATLLFRK